MHQQALQSLVCTQGQLWHGAAMKPGIRLLRKQLRLKRQTREVSLGSVSLASGAVFRLQNLILVSACCRYACAKAPTLLILSLRWRFDLLAQLWTWLLTMDLPGDHWTLGWTLVLSGDLVCSPRLAAVGLCLGWWGHSHSACLTLSLGS